MAYFDLILVGALACALSFGAGMMVDNAVNTFCGRLDAQATDSLKKTIALQNETINILQENLARHQAPFVTGTLWRHEQPR